MLSCPLGLTHNRRPLCKKGMQLFVFSGEEGYTKGGFYITSDFGNNNERVKHIISFL